MSTKVVLQVDEMDGLYCALFKNTNSSEAFVPISFDLASTIVQKLTCCPVEFEYPLESYHKIKCETQTDHDVEQLLDDDHDCFYEDCSSNDDNSCDGYSVSEDECPPFLLDSSFVCFKRSRNDYLEDYPEDENFEDENFVKRKKL